MYLIKKSDKSVVDSDISPDLTLQEICDQRGFNVEEYDVLYTANEKKHLVRSEIEKDVADIPSLLGKTANFTAALARIQLNIMSKLAVANSLEDVRESVAEYVPFMQQLQAKIDAGEILSVQSAQGATDEEAIFEGLEALTKVANIIQAS